MSCVRLRKEREGKTATSESKLFRDEIIVWLHLFTPMAQSDSAKQHKLAVFISSLRPTPVYKDIFSASFG